MKKEDFIALGISDELAKKCADAFAEELKAFIPKARFDEVNNEKKKLEADLGERDSKLEQLKTSAGDLETLKKQVSDFQKEIKAKDEAHAAEIKKLKVDAAVDAALSGAKAKNSVAVRALLKDIDKADFNDDGTVKGLVDQIKNIKKSDPYLFDNDAPTAPKLKGAVPGESGVDSGDGPVDFSKMTYSQSLKYLNENPGAKIE